MRPWTVFLWQVTPRMISLQLSLPEYWFKPVLSFLLPRSGWLYIAPEKEVRGASLPGSGSPKVCLGSQMFLQSPVSLVESPLTSLPPSPPPGQSSSYSILNPCRCVLPLSFCWDMSLSPHPGVLLHHHCPADVQCKFDLRQAAVALWSRVIMGHQIKGLEHCSQTSLKEARCSSRGDN